MAFINPKLVPLKVFLFCCYGALGCLWPFLTVHMRSLGLTLEETAIISLVLPFTSLLGPPIAGALADKLGRYKVVLVLCLLMAGVSFSCLLFVPPVVRFEPRQPSLLFKCDSNGGTIQLERCNHRCELPEAKYQIALTQCKVNCPTALLTATPTQEEDHADDIIGELDEVDFGNVTSAPEVKHDLKPVICFQQKPNECHIYNASGLNESIVLYFNVLRSTSFDDDKCVYPLTAFLKDGVDDFFTGTHCRSNEPLEGCKVVCNINQTNSANALHNRMCVDVEGDPFLTFWVYFLVRGIAELFPASCLALLDATILHMVRVHNSHYGREILFGIAAIGIFPPIVGYLSDIFGESPDRPDYTPPFIAFDILLLIAAITAIFIDMERNEYARRLCRYVGKLLQNAEVLVLFVVMFLIGTQFGFVETFFYWFLQDMKASQFLLGLTLTVGVLPSLPFLYFGDKIVKKCGNANLLIVALFVYSIRFTGYAYIPDPWWSLPFEALEVFTLNLMWVATATYCARLSPQMLLATTMGLTTVLHYNAGRGVGALSGGYIMDTFGARIAYQSSAVFSGIVGLLYFAIYHFYLKDRESPIPSEPMVNGHRTPYTNGELQAYKPMLKPNK